MTARAAAKRYARALFDVAKAERIDFETIDGELAGVAAFVAGNEALHRAFANPAIPAARKRAVLSSFWR